jgi:hypothetical protein
MHVVMARPSESTFMCCSPLDIQRAVDNATHELEQNQLLAVELNYTRRAASNIWETAPRGQTT